MSNQNPQVINERYEISRRIGRGGMADVFLARDLLLDRDVAVKVLFPEHAVDPNFVERFRREAQSVAGLNHPNIVGVYDWGQTGNTYFMAMEFVKGRTLSEALRRQGRMTSVSAAGVGAAIANALAYAHRNNVVHRDIKPANILLGEDGAIKVVDFGIARALDAGHEGGLTQDGAVMGTATYFSPEQAKGEGLDLRSDLYSLGVVLYELVAGKPPFAGDSALATAYKQVNEAAPRLRDLVPDVPLALEAIIAKCLTKNADMRYNNAEQLRDDLRRFMNGEPTLAVDEARVRSGKAPLGSATLDQATTIMAPIQGDSSSTQILPRTSVMPATMAPVEVLPDYDDDRPSKRSYVVGAAVAGIVILGGIIFLISTLGGSSGVSVPNVKGVSCDVAKLKLEEAQFIVAFNPPETVCDATNIVSGQVPASGDLAKTGEAITLVFPVAQADVPPLLGLTVEAAQADVEGAGFVFAKGPDVIDKTYAIGQVAVQTPAGMTKLAKGQTVTVNVSGGTGQLAVPNVVIGQTTESAQTFLIAEPYKFVVTVTPEPSATVLKGIVIRTDPVQGTLVDAASPITIFVSNGPAPVAMPNVKGQTEAAAVAALGKLGITATVEYVDLAAGNANVGKVIAQDTAAASMVNPGSAVVLTVGRDTAVTVAPAG
jgi:serine/threonine protein kinase/beta-lactam-binding protein with PASTA domain